MGVKVGGMFLRVGDGALPEFSIDFPGMWMYAMPLAGYLAKREGGWGGKHCGLRVLDSRRAVRVRHDQGDGDAHGLLDARAKATFLGIR